MSLRASSLLWLLGALLSPRSAAADSSGYFEDQCRAGQWFNCDVAAKVREDKGDIPGAVELYGINCKHGPTCQLYQLANRLSAKGQLADGVKVLQNGCGTYHDVFSCYWLATRYRDGDGVPRNGAKAAELLQRVCDQKALGGDRGCADLGRLYASGIGVPKNAARARALQAKARRLIDQRMRAGVTRLQALVAKDRPQYEAWERDCVAGKTTFCGSAAFLYLPTDLEHAYRLGLAGCKEHPEQCVTMIPMVAQGLLDDGKPTRATDVLQEACDRGDLTCCYMLGGWLADGVVPRDAPRARAILTAACDDEEQMSCERVAQMMEDGAGGPLDAAGAAALHQRAKRMAWEQRFALVRLDEKGRKKRREEQDAAGQKLADGNAAATAASQKAAAIADQAKRDADASRREQEALAPYVAQLGALQAESLQQQRGRRDGDRLNGSPYAERLVEWRAIIDQLTHEAADPN